MGYSPRDGPGNDDISVQMGVQWRSKGKAGKERALTRSCQPLAEAEGTSQPRLLLTGRPAGRNERVLGLLQPEVQAQAGPPQHLGEPAW